LGNLVGAPGFESGRALNPAAQAAQRILRSAGSTVAQRAPGDSESIEEFEKRKEEALRQHPIMKESFEEALVSWEQLKQSIAQFPGTGNFARVGANPLDWASRNPSDWNLYTLLEYTNLEQTYSLAERHYGKNVIDWNTFDIEQAEMKNREALLLGGDFNETEFDDKVKSEKFRIENFRTVLAETKRYFAETVYYFSAYQKAAMIIRMCNERNIEADSEANRKKILGQIDKYLAGLRG